MKSGSRIIAEYEERIAAGYGCGTQSEYRPWLTVVSSRSRANRSAISLLTTGNRVMYLLSQTEVLAARMFDWNPYVVDIREQFPLNPERTLAIAAKNGWQHPGYTRGGIVMTTDFLVSYRMPDGHTFERAFQVKDKLSSISNRRTQEKLLIEKAYWDSLNIEWQVLVGESFNKFRSHNVEFLAPFRRRNFSINDLETMTETVHGLIGKDCVLSLRELALSCPELRPGIESLKILCAHQRVAFPIDHKKFLDCVLSDFVIGDRP